MSNQKLIIFIVLLLAITIGFPMLLIWAFNTLFPLNIEYGFVEWFAAAVIIQLFGGTRHIVKTVDTGINVNQDVSGLTKH